MEVWRKMFAVTPVRLMARALQQVTESSERMPTPATVKKAIDLILDKEPWLSPNFQKLPTCVPGYDANGVPCVFWTDNPTVPAYSAKNCPEGRVFLNLMAEYKSVVKRVRNEENPIARHGQTIKQEECPPKVPKNA